MLIGAAISTGTNYLLAVRRENAEKEKDELARARDLKRAARLIEDEFAVAVAGMTRVVEKRGWVWSGLKLSTESYQRDKGIIALELSMEDWKAVRLGAMAVREVEVFFAKSPSKEAVSDANFDQAKALMLDLEDGRKALRKYVDHPETAVIPA